MAGGPEGSGPGMEREKGVWGISSDRWRAAAELGGQIRHAVAEFDARDHSDHTRTRHQKAERKVERKLPQHEQDQRGSGTETKWACVM